MGVRITAQRVVLAAAALLALLALVLAAVAATSNVGPAPTGSGGTWWTGDHILTLVLAVANIVLAGAALWTIRSSNRIARATEQSVGTEKEALLTSTRPTIVEHSQDLGLNSDAMTAFARVRIRNIGNGPAFLRKAEFVAGVSEPKAAVVLARAVLPRGEDTLLEFLVSKGGLFYDELTQDHGEFAFAINYDDISGTQRNRTIIRSTIPARHQATIMSVGIYACDGNDWRRRHCPFAGTDPRADETWWGHEDPEAAAVFPDR